MIYILVILDVLLIVAIVWAKKLRKELDRWTKQYEYADAKHWEARNNQYEMIHRQGEKIFALEKELDTYRKAYWPLPKKDQQ